MKGNPPLRYTDLAFSFAKTLEELEQIDQLAAGFIDPISRDILKAFRSNLANFQARPTNNRTFSWKIPETQPLRTRVSQGKFERGEREGGISVYGALSCIWEVAIRPNAQDHFYLTGNASTKLKVCQVLVDEHGNIGLEEEIARWRFEVGAEDSPGCYFHTQILGEADRGMFPSTLPVPRLPSLLITPTDALNFLLGELFQNEWGQEMMSGKPQVVVWSRHQRKRLEKLLEWKLEQVRNTRGSPWINLKQAKPTNEAMLLERQMRR